MSSFSIRDFEDLAKTNSKFRSVIYTGGKDLQVVVQNLSRNQRIPFEKHENAIQVFNVVDGSGFINTRHSVQEVSSGSLVIIEKGVEHEVVAGDQGLKFFTIYTAKVH